MATPDFSASATSEGGAGATSPGPETLTPLEQEVLDEYARLAGNLNDVGASSSLASTSPLSVFRCFWFAREGKVERHFG